MMKKSIFNSTDNLILLQTTHHNIDQPTHRTQARKTMHTQAVQQHLLTIPNNKILNRYPPDIDKTKTELPRRDQQLLAQLRANESPLLLSCLHHIDPATNPSPNCLLCRVAEHKGS